MQKTAGLLLFLAGTIILIGIVTAEIFYPNYNVSKLFISTLGSTRPPIIIIKQPSATIFDSAMILAGFLILGATYFLKQIKYGQVVLIPMIFMGAGTAGVGFFPAFHFYAHSIAAAMAFIAGGIAAVLSYKTTASPFRYLALILGLITLIFLALGELAPQLIVPTLGNGGVERFVAYPIIIWLIGIGANFMNSKSSKEK